MDLLDKLPYTGAAQEITNHFLDHLKDSPLTDEQRIAIRGLTRVIEQLDGLALEAWGTYWIDVNRLDVASVAEREGMTSEERLAHENAALRHEMDLLRKHMEPEPEPEAEPEATDGRRVHRVLRDQQGRLEGIVIDD